MYGIPVDNLFDEKKEFSLAEAERQSSSISELNFSKMVSQDLSFKALFEKYKDKVDTASAVWREENKDCFFWNPSTPFPWMVTDHGIVPYISK